MLTPEQIPLIKATVPALEAHGVAITETMYRHLFKDATVRDLFNQANHENGMQPRALAAAILAYAKHIDALGALSPMVERIAQKHVGLQILPEHYPYVAAALLTAIKEVLGDAATDEIMAAWGNAYWALADILIGRERTLYGAIAETPGGWSGWRDFVIEAVIPECAVISSFVLRPVDGAPVMAHKPGQYLTFNLDLGDGAPTKRNYSISGAANGETYRISVKREPEGRASVWMHDEARVGTVLRVAPPAGDFFLPDAPERPVVLMSGGVGLTPMVAMLETIAERHPDLPVHYVHGTLNGETHAMRDHVAQLCAGRDNLRASVFYEVPRLEDAAGRDYDHDGRITPAWLLSQTETSEAEYYLCGPRPFLAAMVRALNEGGVPRERVHFEYFGPADSDLV